MKKLHRGSAQQRRSVNNILQDRQSRQKHQDYTEYKDINNRNKHNKYAITLNNQQNPDHRYYHDPQIKKMKLKTLNHSRNNQSQTHNHHNQLINDSRNQVYGKKIKSRLTKNRRYSQANSPDNHSDNKILMNKYVEGKSRYINSESKNDNMQHNNHQYNNKNKLKNFQLRRSRDAHHRPSLHGNTVFIKNNKAIFNSNNQILEADQKDLSSQNKNMENEDNEDTKSYLLQMQQLQAHKNQRIKQIYNPTQKTKSISNIRSKIPTNVLIKKISAQDKPIYENEKNNTKRSNNLRIINKSTEAVQLHGNYERHRYNSQVNLPYEEPSNHQKSNILKISSATKHRIQQLHNKEANQQVCNEEHTSNQNNNGNLPLPKFSKFYDKYMMTMSHNNFKCVSQSTKVHDESSRVLFTPHSKQIEVNQLRQIQHTSPISSLQDLGTIKQKNKSVQNIVPKLEILQELENQSQINIIKEKQGTYYGQIDEHHCKSGKGVYFFHSGVLYQGCFQNGQRKGYGKQTHPDGSVYNGQYQNDVRNGKGRYQWPNGEIYDGQWLNNKKHGSGLWQDFNGSSYLGEWNEGSISGMGILTTLSNNQQLSKNRQGLYQRYEGQFKNFSKQGQGTYRFANGQKIIGIFHKNQPNGECEYYWNNGDYYKGNFINGMRHGKGFTKYSNGGQFEGDFRNDKKCGFGRQRYHDGIMFIGNFENDLRHGYGRLEYREVVYYEGYWMNNKAVIFHEKDGEDHLGSFQNIGDMGSIEQDVINQRLVSGFSNNLSRQNLGKLKIEQQRRIIKAMKSKQKLDKSKVQKFANRDLIQRLYNPRKRACRCAAKH